MPDTSTIPYPVLSQRPPGHRPRLGWGDGLALGSVSGPLPSLCCDFSLVDLYGGRRAGTTTTSSRRAASTSRRSSCSSRFGPSLLPLRPLLALGSEKQTSRPGPCQHRPVVHRADAGHGPAAWPAASPRPMAHRASWFRMVNGCWADLRCWDLPLHISYCIVCHVIITKFTNNQ